MKTRISMMIISLLLVCAMVLNFTGCVSKETKKESLMKGINPNPVTPIVEPDTQNEVVADFAVRLFQASENSGNNTLISPLSVLCALAMTANGAQEETLAQMEDVLGMNTQDLNLYVYSYMQSLLQDEENTLSLANSIWLTQDEQFTVNPNFLQANADYYGADIYQAPFNDQTLKDINNWVKQSTDGMIPKILNQIPEEAVMYLVNALAFEAEWMDIYEEYQVREDVFTKEDGSTQNVEFMYATEYDYFEDENATGFMKEYKGGHYAFVALLPKEGISVSEYVASLNGTSLNRLLSNPQDEIVRTAIPKFETEFELEMADILQAMGMTDAFDVSKANFESLGTMPERNIYISRVLHKTFISVAEKGTKAGAATVVEMAAGSAAPGKPVEPKIVYLDRPFVYMLIDCENNIPFFIGTMMDVN